jgi:hypothetical protein
MFPYRHSRLRVSEAWRLAPERRTPALCDQARGVEQRNKRQLDAHRLGEDLPPKCAEGLPSQSERLRAAS